MRVWIRTTILKLIWYYLAKLKNCISYNPAIPPHRNASSTGHICKNGPAVLVRIPKTRKHIHRLPTVDKLFIPITEYIHIRVCVRVCKTKRNEYCYTQQEWLLNTILSKRTVYERICSIGFHLHTIKRQVTLLYLRIPGCRVLLCQQGQGYTEVRPWPPWGWAMWSEEALRIWGALAKALLLQVSGSYTDLPFRNLLLYMFSALFCICVHVFHNKKEHLYKHPWLLK